MNILITGKYSPEYNRNRILINGLRGQGISLTEAPYNKKKEFNPSEYLESDEQFDFVFLPAFTHYDVRFIKKKLKLPVVFDPLISKYLTKVADYKSVLPYSPRALKNFLKDRFSMKAADIVLADTEAHRQYYINKIGIDPKKIHVVPVGVDITDFSPSETEIDSDIFKIGFYGSYIPLHGIENIIRAAQILQKHSDIKFQVVGNGPNQSKMKKLAGQLGLNNLELIDWVPYKELSGTISRYDICLGIFGDSLKAQLVIPNKIYHYCAVGKPVITMESTAIREVFTPGKDIITCDGSASDIAAKIIVLKDNRTLRDDIAAKGMSLIRENYNESSVAEKFLSAVKEVTDKG